MNILTWEIKSTSLYEATQNDILSICQLMGTKIYLLAKQIPCVVRCTKDCWWTMYATSCEHVLEKHNPEYTTNPVTCRIVDSHILSPHPFLAARVCSSSPENFTSQSGNIFIALCDISRSLFCSAIALAVEAYTSLFRIRRHRIQFMVCVQCT